MFQLSFKTFLLILLAGVIAACENTNTNGYKILEAPDANGTTATYLFYNTPLSAVDPANPALPLAVEVPGTATGNVTPFRHGNFDSINNRIRDRHIRTIFYLRTASSSFWRVSALKSGSLTPTQVSNEAGITQICSNARGNDYADHDNSRYVYRLPGANAKCDALNSPSDDIWKMVTLGMGAGDAPIPAYRPITPVNNPQSGALQGWLTLTGGNLVYYDMNFSAGSAVTLSAVATSVTHAATGPGGHIILNLDGKLYVFDPANPAALSAALHTFAGASGSYVRDDTGLYFRDGSFIYKLPLDGSANASLIHTEASGNPWLVFTTMNRVVFTNGATLKSVPKTGGAVTILQAGSPMLVGKSGKRVYYNIVWFSGTWNSTAHVVDEDGNNADQHANSAWFVWTEPDEASFGASKPDLGISRVLLKKGMVAPFALASYDAATHQLIANLGTMPADMSQQYDPFFARFPNRGGILGRAYSSATSSTDMLYLNTEQANSLVRLTSTNTASEVPVGAVGCTLSPRADFDITLLLSLFAAAGYLLRRRFWCDR